MGLSPGSFPVPPRGLQDKRSETRSLGLDQGATITKDKARTQAIRCYTHRRPHDQVGKPPPPPWCPLDIPPCKATAQHPCVIHHERSTSQCLNHGRKSKRCLLSLFSQYL